MNFFKRPLFYSAILVALVLAVTPAATPSSDPRSDDVLHFATSSKESIYLGGQIVSEVETQPAHFGGRQSSFILKVSRVWKGLGEAGQEVRGKVRVICQEPRDEFSYGDVLVLGGDLDPIPSVRNPGGFDARQYWMRQGVSASLKAKKKFSYKILSRGAGHPFKEAAIRVKRGLSHSLSDDFDPQSAAFLKALFLGERSELDEETKDLFLRTGTMHLLAVSGFNLGFLFAAFWFLLKPIPISRDPKLFIVLIVLWGYTGLVGWQPPVVRAAVMLSAVIFAKLLGRKADTLNLLGLAALIVLVIHPKDVMDIGFQLSFIAVWGMASFTSIFIVPPKVLPHEKPGWIEKAWQGSRELFWISFICLVVTLPITVQNFYILTPWSMLVNILVVPLSFLIFFAGAIYFLTLLIIPGDWLVVLLTKMLITLFIKILNFFEALPGAVVVVGKLHEGLWCLLVAGLLILLYSKKIKRPVTRALSILIFIGVIFLSQETLRLYRPYWTVEMLDVGQGDSIFMSFPQKGYWLVDGGTDNPDQGRKVIVPFLRSKGIRELDAVVYSHPQEDHIGGLLSVLDEIRVKEIFFNGRSYGTHLHDNFWKKAKAKKIKSRVLLSGDTVEGYPGMKISALHPKKDAAFAANVNEDSLVLKIQHDQNSLLLTGDIEDKGLESLLSEDHDLNIDILKFPHHGGKVGAEGARLIERCSPDWVLMSLGAKNPFGHPHASALRAAQDVPNGQLLRTDQEGAIELRSDGKRIWRA